jgi:MYXO-CTERM domain-containing protein
VTLFGQNFDTAPTVTFDNVAAKVQTVNPSFVSVITPPHAAGMVDIVITNGDAQTSKTQYTYSDAVAMPDGGTDDGGAGSGGSGGGGGGGSGGGTGGNGPIVHPGGGNSIKSSSGCSMGGGATSASGSLLLLLACFALVLRRRRA